MTDDLLHRPMKDFDGHEPRFLVVEWPIREADDD